MTKFTVQAQETVFYEFTIEADSMEEAKIMIHRGDFDTGPAIDGEDFEISSIEEETVE